MLADHLLTLNITTKLEPRAGAWAVWVHREDRVAEARALLDDFERNPNDPRFQASAKTAREIRKQAEQTEKAYQKRARDLRDRWEGAMYLRAPLAFWLIILSVAVTLLMKFYPPTRYWLAFSVRVRDESGSIIDTGFAAIQDGQVWRIITPIFLHFGIFHLFFNMTAMRYLGEQVEMRKGTWRLALICLVAAIGGNIGEFYKSGGAFGGMSGVVYSLAGYLWVKGHTDPADGLRLSERSVQWMLGWFLLGIIAPLTVVSENPASLGFPYNMANVAHGVGLGVGMVFGLLRF